MIISGVKFHLTIKVRENSNRIKHFGWDGLGQCTDGGSKTYKSTVISLVNIICAGIKMYDIITINLQGLNDI